MITRVAPITLREGQMAFTGLDLVKAIASGSTGMAPPPWVEHFRIREENPIESVETGRLVSIWTPGDQNTVMDGYVQGGIVTAIADGAQTLALISTQDELEAWVTLDFHTRFVRPIKAGARVEIDTIVLNKSKTSALIESTFMLPEGKLAAKVTGGWRHAAGRRGLEPPKE